ncbi:3-dehydroquinate synthase [Anaerocolumna aminovalerica]|uniref:3-dehydroquinate synthase n=1 Tax=Anaerocolumna aminovalerica TaxID=1527 RepID=A0A1I5CHV6_9FIRM|nr:3-dehydroquinate synthase [Anaerocolumna aminovalerica]SFN86615.1 3-dehydroquinate synthase [Anaerocolumna aminovalerica]
MNSSITVNYNNKPIYDILIENDYVQLIEELDKLGTENLKLCIVSDTNVSKLYMEELRSLLKEHAKTVETFVFRSGEDSKNLDTVYSLYEHLIRAKFDRKDLLIALGGGVTGDLTGYAAATYLRGIGFIQMPTSLLAMVDSSIGGKTGVDFQSYKNMIGAFHQPESVYINLSTLESLSNRQYYAGLGEIIKHGLIKEPDYYQWLKDHKDEIKSRDIPVMKEMIYRSCLIKREVVEKDPKELGERALLNFGHTIGHAVENLTNFSLLHGECVAVGMAASCYISYKRGYLLKEELDNIIGFISSFDLPVKVSGIDPEEIFQATAHDKKMEFGKLKFILLSEIGQAFMDTSVTQEELMDGIRFILK